MSSHFITDDAFGMAKALNRHYQANLTEETLVEISKNSIGASRQGHKSYYGEPSIKWECGTAFLIVKYIDMDTKEVFHTLRRELTSEEIEPPKLTP